MAFLAPLFLLGLGALAVPVIIHLQRRQQATIQEFPSLMFLRQIETTSIRRRWLHHWWLLALRCAAVAALVFAFARPWVASQALSLGSGEPLRTRLILVDDSYSMGEGERWNRAREAVAGALRDLGPGDRAALVVFSDQAQVRVEPTSDLQQILNALGDLQPSDRGTRLGPAIRVSRKLLGEEIEGVRELVLVSDFQRVAWRADEALALPPGVTVELRNVAENAAAPANWMLDSVVFDRRRDGDRERVGVQGRITRTGAVAGGSLPVVLELGGRELQAIEVSVESGDLTQVEFSPFSLPDGISRGSVALTAPGLAADDRLFFTLSRQQAVPIAIAERNRDGEPSTGFYLENSLALAKRPPFRVRTVSESRLTREVIEESAVVILSDVRMTDGSVAAALKRHVESGGGLLVALGSNFDAASELISAGLVPAPAGSAVRRTEGGGRITRFDRSHPGFEIFAAPRSGDFGSARFFRYHPLNAQESDAVLASFDDGRPALIERRVGSGRVLIWASTLDRYWSDFVLQPLFVPFLLQSVQGLSDYRFEPSFRTVGQFFDLDDWGVSRGPEAAAIARVQSPSGLRLESQGLLSLEEAGFYEIEDEAGAVFPVAVNRDRAEGDLAFLDTEALMAALQPGATGQNPDGQAGEISPAEAESRQGLWRFLILGVLILLVIETVVANPRPLAT